MRIIVRLSVGMLAVVLSCLLLATSSVAYNKKLTPDDIKAAIEYGKTRHGKDLVDRDSPYFVSLDPYNFVLLSTPWLEVAWVALKAAGEYRDPTDNDIRSAIDSATGRLEISGSLIQQIEGRFWEDFHAVIIQGSTTVQPLRKNGSFRKVVSCQSSPCAVSAGILAIFPDEHLDPVAPAEIIIILQSGRKELRKTVDLATLR
jgi:hypothetical protein